MRKPAAWPFNWPYLLAAVLAAGSLAVIISCDKGGEEAPLFPTAPASSGTVSSAEAAPAAPAAAAPTNQNPMSFSVEKNGTVLVHNTKSNAWSGAICYFNEGPHPQLLAAGLPITVPPNKRASFPLPDDLGCDLNLQIDVGDIDCSRPSNSLGAIYAFARNVETAECVCEPGEWKEISRTEPVYGEWGECPEDDVILEQCFECRDVSLTITESNGCAERTVPVDRVERNEIDCPCIETGPVETKETEWAREAFEGKCPEPNASTPPKACYEHNFGTETTTLTYTCKDPEETQAKVCRDREIDCPCIEQWIPQEPEITYDEWGECELLPTPDFAPDFAGLTDTPEPPMCDGHKHRTVRTIIREINSCTQEVRVRSDDETVEEGKCQLPCEGDCYYNISGHARFHQYICENTTGGFPPAPGQWGRWPEGPPSDHCYFTVPGIYADPLRKLQLTPGQSHPRCNKF